MIVKLLTVTKPKSYFLSTSVLHQQHSEYNFASKDKTNPFFFELVNTIESEYHSLWLFTYQKTRRSPDYLCKFSIHCNRVSGS